MCMCVENSLRVCIELWTEISGAVIYRWSASRITTRPPYPLRTRREIFNIGRRGPGLGGGQASVIQVRKWYQHYQFGLDLDDQTSARRVADNVVDSIEWDTRRKKLHPLRTLVASWNTPLPRWSGCELLFQFYIPLYGAKNSLQRIINAQERAQKSCALTPSYKSTSCVVADVR